jgi:pyruvate/2-oxoglutarate dehydrogenase complex dihydrolipoamide acyltransferase (E2) component
MSMAVVLPALGESVVEGTIASWLVKEGDRVERDQPLVEVTTDKVDAEIPAPVSGIVERIAASEGEVVPIGAELAWIATLDTAHGIPHQTRHVTPHDPAERAEPDDESANPTPSRSRATPLAMRVADAQNVPLESVSPTGIGGRVVKRDVLRHVSLRAESVVEAVNAVPANQSVEPGAGAAKGPSPEQPSFARYELQDGDRVIQMTPLRRLVADHMVYSKQTSPHVGTVAEIDMAGVSTVRDEHKNGFSATHGFALSFLPFLVHATVRALREFPALNASVLGDAIVEKVARHIGVAVETDKGLVVPVIRHADRLSLGGLACAIEDLSSRARSKRLSADELRGGSFTISNPGRNGNLYGFAIINQPQVAILRMGEIVKRPVVRSPNGEDVVVIRPVMHLALSYDHRAVDGAPANAFLHRVRELLERAEFDL